MKELQKQLQRLEKPQLEREARNRMKDSVMNSLGSVTYADYMPSSLGRFVQKIRAVAFLVVPSDMLKMRVREKVYAKMEAGTGYKFSFNWMRALSSALVFVLVLSSFFFFAFEANVTEAHSLTRISAITGDVLVVRSDREIKAELGMVLLEGDLIKTTEGAVTIVYHDDSVTRLSSDTQLNINTLTVDDINTQVKLFVETGNVWTNVPSLAGEDSSFGIGFVDYSAQVSTKATFNLEVSQDQPTELEVYESVVYVESKANDTKPVMNGYKVALEDDKDVSLLPLVDEDTELDWVKANISEDEKYVETVVARVIDQAKADIIEPKQDNVSINETQLDDITTDNLSPEEVLAAKMLLFDNKLSQYEILLAEGQATAAAKNLIDIKLFVDQLLTDIAAFDDQTKAENFRDTLNRTLALHKKNLTLVAPNGVYGEDAQELIYDIKANLAISEDAKREVELQKAEDVLLNTVNSLDKANLDEIEASLDLEDLDDKNASLLAIIKEETEETQATLEPAVPVRVQAPALRVEVNSDETVTTRIAPNVLGDQNEQILPPQFHLNFQRPDTP